MKTKKTAFCGLFTGLICLCAFIRVPLPFTPVPITLQTFAIALAGLLLGKKYGFYSVLAYVLLGTAGLPIFSGGGGPGLLAGYTGGFILGFLPCVFVIGFAKDFLAKAVRNHVIVDGTALLAGNLVLYTFGALWYAVSAHVTPMAAFTATVLPFLPGDMFKMGLTVLMARLLENPVKYYYPGS